MIHKLIGRTVVRAELSVTPSDRSSAYLMRLVFDDGDSLVVEGKPDVYGVDQTFKFAVVSGTAE